MPSYSVQLRLNMLEEHASSTTFSLALDFDRLIRLLKFKCIVKDNVGNIKLVIVVSVDDGLEVNAHYTKVICTGIHYFVE